MTELWRELGGYQAMVDAGVDMVVAEARIRYLAALRFDDEFEVRATVVRIGSTSMTTEIELSRGDETVVEGELRHVFIESGGGAPPPIPESIRSGSGPVLRRFGLTPSVNPVAASWLAGASGRRSSAASMSASENSRSSSSPAR